MCNFMSFLVLVCSYCILFDSKCAGYKILGVFPNAAPSTHILGSALMKGVADAGHDATLISAFPDEYTPNKGNGTFRVIHIDGLKEHLMQLFKKAVSTEDGKKDKKNNLFAIHTFGPFMMMHMVSNMGKLITEYILQHDAMQKLIHSGEQFDAIIIQQFANDALKGLAPHFNAHLFVFSNVGLNSWINFLSGNPSLPSYAPEILTGLPVNMNFWQRMYNLIFSFFSSIVTHLIILPNQKELMEKYIPTKENFYDVLYNASFHLINSHVSITHSLPTVPNMAFVGGYHIKPPKTLPDDLKKFMDEAEDGVVYFSLGSNFKSNNLPDAQRAALLKAFAKLKQKVLWKFENDTLPGQPENVKLSKWLPQADILAHPNIKLFITHGGYGSTLETLYHGVPIIAMPIAADQNANAENAKNMGYGIVLNIGTLTEDIVSNALREVLNNSKYRDTAKLKSTLFHDRQMEPMDEILYWLEYVIKHNGARHLRVVSLDLHWYQYYLLDIFAFFVLLTYGSYYVVFKLRRK